MINRMNLICQQMMMMKKFNMRVMRNLKKKEPFGMSKVCGVSYQVPGFPAGLFYVPGFPPGIFLCSLFKVGVAHFNFFCVITKKFKYMPHCSEQTIQYSFKIHIFLTLGWNLDPCDMHIMAPRLMIGMEVGSSEIRSELDYILLFFPMNFIRDSVILATKS